MANLQKRNANTGALLRQVGLSSSDYVMRRLPNGQQVALAGEGEVRIYSRRPTLLETIAVDIDPASYVDWNIDEDYYVYRLQDQTVDCIRLYDDDVDVAGTIAWTKDLSGRDFHAPTRALAGGNGQQVLVSRSSGIGGLNDPHLRVVGYIGGATWTGSDSEAALVTMRRSDGHVMAVQRFGGDSNDHAQAIAVWRVGDCLILAGAASGDTFEGLDLSGTQGWLLRLSAGLI